MIIREFGVRQAQRALTAPSRQACLRALSSQTVPPTPTPTPTGVPDLTEPSIQSPNAQTPKTPSIFTSQTRTPGRRRKPAAPDTTVRDFEQARALRQQIDRVGTRVKKNYRPADVFINPPGPKDVTLELLMASQAHMGHHMSLWNPANARYIYGVRQGIHIISLEQTAAHLRRAARVVEDVAYRGGLILFVGTRPGQTQIVTQAAKLAKACHLFTKWTPGSITNSDIILGSMQMQMLDEHDKPLDGYDVHLNERRPLIPDLVVCLNPLENFSMLYECSLVNIPSIGVIDTNTEPSWVTYAIPANDDSLRCIAVIGSVLGRAGEMGQKRRLEDAKKGVVEWTTPLDVQRFNELSGKFLDTDASMNKSSETSSEDPLAPESMNQIDKELLDMYGEDDLTDLERGVTQEEAMRMIKENDAELNLGKKD
ncbi:37S ribosomal protein MRP4 [Xylariaceae sp. FL0016]|nr:37S ribosomal protein MRP4 [Xylariaceae sp. FL0016]